MYAAHNMQNQTVRIDFSCKAARTCMDCGTHFLCCSMVQLLLLLCGCLFVGFFVGLLGFLKFKTLLLPNSFPSGLFMEDALIFLLTLYTEWHMGVHTSPNIRQLNKEVNVFTVLITMRKDPPEGKPGPKGFYFGWEEENMSHCLNFLWMRALVKG